MVRNLMIWRLLSTPVILSILLLGLGLSVNNLGENKTELSELIESQKIDILSLNVEKAIYQLTHELNQRRALFEKNHNLIKKNLENNPQRALSYWQEYLNQELGFVVDVSLIDENFVIVDTTFLPDLGLDFTDPRLSDTQVAFAQASTTDNVVSSPPTQELISGDYKVYTLSKLSQGGFLQLGFIDPILKEYFESATSMLQTNDRIVSAELFFKVDNSESSTSSEASILHPFIQQDNYSEPAKIEPEVDKLDYLQLRAERLSGELDNFKSATVNNYVELADPDDPNSTVVYLKLSTSLYFSDIPVKYLAKLKIQTPQASWAETYAYSMNIGIILIITILLIAAFIDIRLRIVKPLIELKKALEQNDEIELSSKQTLFPEIRYLIKSYNQYRINNQALTSQLRHSAITDPLTGLYNRSAIKTIYEKLNAVARRNNRLLALAFIDVDHFKEYNDLYGHQCGDNALIALSNSIKETFRRPTDAGVRFGGEEFLIFFDSENFSGAQRQVGRLIESLKNKAIEHEGNSSSELLTMSIGLAVIKPNMDIELDELIKISDEAVYQAKIQGRNTTVARNIADVL